MTDLDGLYRVANKYGKTHRKLVQLALKNGVIVVHAFFEKFVDLVNGDLDPDKQKYSVENIGNDEENSLIDKVLRCINAEIRRAKMRLVRIDDEYNDTMEYIVLVSQLQPNKSLSCLSPYTSDERNLLRAWLDNILTRGEGEIAEYVALNVAEGTITKRRAQELLDSLVAGMWMEKTGNAVLKLSVRGIAELLPFFAESYRMSTCASCSRVVIFKQKAFECSSCGFYVHRQCWLKLRGFGDAGVAKCPRKLESGRFCGAALEAVKGDADNEEHGTRKRPLPGRQDEETSEKRPTTTGRNLTAIEEGTEMIID